MPIEDGNGLYRHVVDRVVVGSWSVLVVPISVLFLPQRLIAIHNIVVADRGKVSSVVAGVDSRPFDFPPDVGLGFVGLSG